MHIKSLLILSFLLSGCATFQFKTYEDAFNNIFDSTKTYQDMLLYTYKADVIGKDSKVNAIINVTYLNETSKKWDKKNTHNFAIAIFIVTDNISEEKQYIKNKEYKLYINGSLNYRINTINNDDSILKNIPLKNEWAQYYLVSINKNILNKSNKHSIKIEYIHDIYKNAIIEFSVK